MSFAFLKNVLFPRSQQAGKGWAVAAARPNNQSTDNEKIATTSRPGSTISSSTTLDLEAQQCDSCRPRLPGQEAKAKHGRFKPSPRMISDAIIGLSDGLTVPFALTAGLSSLGNARLVVLGGLAELIAGAISMGLGGFIGAKSEAASYKATVASTKKLIETSPCQTSSLVHTVFKPYGLSAMSTSTISNNLHESPPELLDFLMRFHHQMPEPETSRPFVSAATIAAGYFIGGFIPLLPYLCVQTDEVLLALYVSIGVMAVALFAFGWAKTGVVSGWRGRKNVIACVIGGVQMIVVGSAAAGAAVGLVRAIDRGQDV
ncbi:hypothetical protein MMC17_006884 [Xylographa soralifera]|nr:hypothetical protein [Xylographa soralifera]MCJ1383770.1 hypothetical protein [Xylographa soralifera]